MNDSLSEESMDNSNNENNENNECEQITNERKTIENLNFTDLFEDDFK